MKWVCFCFGILLTISKFRCEEEKNGKSTNKDIEVVKKLIQSDPNDKSAVDPIIKYNAFVLENELKVEAHQDDHYKYLLHEDAEKIKKLSEGDMLLDKKDLEMEKESINPEEERKRKRGMIPMARKLWISRVVPYEFDHPGTLVFNADKVRSAVLEAMDTISKASCIKFRPMTSNDNNWLRIFKGSGCYSGIGRKFWKKVSTDLSLGDFCIVQPILIHEIFHALGFFHEQSRPDRDSFVNLHWSNINQNMASNFDRHPSYDMYTQGNHYDYSSVMHYGNKAFSVNGQDTINSKFDNNRPLGGDHITFRDKTELNKMYQCNKGNDEVWSSWSPWSLCLKDWMKGCISVRQRVCFAHPENPSKCNGGDKYGVEDLEQKCEDKQCLVEVLQPHWGSWGEYSECSHRCGEGHFTRSRKCDNPPPQNDKQTCGALNVQTSLCRIARCVPSYYKHDADFENGFGPWRRDDKALLLWERTNANTPNSESGPTKPYITKYYVYLAAKKREDNFQTGRLMSNVIPEKNGDMCVTFYYQMNGKEIEYLDFYIRTVKSAQFFTYWSRNNHQGNSWRKGAFNIPNHEEPYEIVVEGKTGRAPHSDIAIDDIRVDKGTCPRGAQGCQSHYKNCKWWARYGECHKNFKWMLKSCCGDCAGSMSKCENLYDVTTKSNKCEEWAKKGECANNKMWMWKNCCTTCKSCVDYSHGCSFWAANGWCKKSNWMLENCKNSCNICKV